nr:MAG TPA: hypothetical protein [Bacteriophage sp.]
MEIKVKRITPIDYPYTIGKMYIDGDYFCDTLEDRVRDINKNGKFDNGEAKIAGETAVPYGRYQVVVNMSPRFKRELPRLLNVPNFEGILIHRGNTDKDSSGCILVGENKVKGKVINSTPYEQKLVSILKDVQNKGEEIWITIE